MVCLGQVGHQRRGEPEGGLDPRQQCAIVGRVVVEDGMKGYFDDAEGLATEVDLFASKGAVAGAQHVGVKPFERVEASAVDDERALAQHTRGLDDVEGAVEEDGPGHLFAHQLETPRARVLSGEGWAAQLQDVDLQPVDRQRIGQTREELVGGASRVVCPVQQIHPEHAEGFLLLLGGGVHQVDVEQHVAGIAPGLGLEAQPDPPVLLVVAFVIARGDGVGEREEARPGATRRPQTLGHQLVFVVEHRQQPLARDIARPGAVGVVADRLVVGADRLCDGAGGGADGEEPPCDLLPRADLGEAAVDRSLEVDRQRLGVGVFGVKLAHLAPRPAPAAAASSSAT